MPKWLFDDEIPLIFLTWLGFPLVIKAVMVLPCHIYRRRRLAQLLIASLQIRAQNCLINLSPVSANFTDVYNHHLSLLTPRSRDITYFISFKNGKEV